jgi:hypothetical protein
MALLVSLTLPEKPSIVQYRANHCQTGLLTLLVAEGPAGMFILVVLHDTICVPPSKFDRDIEAVLTEEIDAQYANKVLARGDVSRPSLCCTVPPIIV